MVIEHNSSGLLADTLSHHARLLVLKDEPFFKCDGRHVIAFDEPHAEIDRENRLHVLHCAGPRVWSYVTIGLNGQLLARSTLVETKTRPHFKRTAEGDVAIVGGMTGSAAARAAENAVPKLSTRPDKPPGD